MVTYRNRDPEPSVRFRPPHPVFKVLAVLFCCVQLLAVPAFAYSSESFVVDTDPYLFKSLRSEAPALMSFDRGVSLAAVDEVEIFNYFMNGSCPASVELVTNSYSPPINVGGINVPGSPVYDFATSSYSSSAVYGGTDLFFYYNSVVIPDYDSEEDNFTSISFPSFPTTYRFSLDLSSFGEFTSFDLTGSFRFRIQLYPVSSGVYEASLCNLYVNGSRVTSFTGPAFDTAGYLYNGTEPVTDITFEFVLVSDDLIYLYDESLIGRSVSPRLSIGNLGNFGISVLKKNDALNGFNDKAQNDLNDFSSTEQQYQTNMQQNWAALNLDSFSFSDSFDNAFALISGIFSDLFLAIGDFSMIYTIPLALGLVAVVIGRSRRDHHGSSGGSVSDSTDLVVRR